MKQQWSTVEIQLFFCCYEMYRNDFHSYVEHFQTFNRSYSQIKAFYYNWLRQQPPEIRKDFVVGKRGGKHVAFRNSELKAGHK
ncbi:SANT/Myb_domain [Hexamita inflata]|uniref:SANT/Myb_domain n=1 Tax=Hexamita inflata TaxID=28002 RepID=A0ABP1GV87_9EUKA